MMVRRFLRQNEGVALIEFVLIFPFIFLLLFGSIETVRLMYIQQKLEKAGYVIADVITRYSPAANPLVAGQISEAEMNANIFPILGRLMSEFKDPTKQAAIVTSIQKQAGVKRIMWQIASPSGGSTDNTLTGCDAQAPANCVLSVVNGLSPGAITGAVVNTPTAFPAAEEGVLATMPDGENLIVSEVFFYYRPILQTVLQATGGAFGTSFFLTPRIYIKRTYFVPRNGDLLKLPPTFPV
jgi:Flp pilus assembly pilin Flp